MSELFFELQEKLAPAIRRGDVDVCERAAAKVLRGLKKTPFHVVLDMEITSDSLQAAKHFDDFLAKVSKKMSVAAAYTEMNGFSINPDRWFCSQFAYIQNGGHEDYDWLSGWQGEYVHDFVLEGLEELQRVYKSKAFRDKANDDACSVCDLIVVIKFQKFMRQAVTQMKELRCPLYVTAHDYDFIAEFRPK